MNQLGDDRMKVRDAYEQIAGIENLCDNMIKLQAYFKNLEDGGELAEEVANAYGMNVSVIRTLDCTISILQQLISKDKTIVSESEIDSVFPLSLDLIK